MAVEFKPPSKADIALDPDFTLRLESSLTQADADRRRHRLLLRARNVLLILLLLGPIVAWRLMLATPDAVHIGITTVAWLAFLLDIGVHVDTGLLGFLGLSALPSLVGFLIFALITATLLTGRHRE